MRYTPPTFVPRVSAGFTILEMLVVIVIMAVLLGMTLKLGNSASREAAVEASAKEFATTIRMTAMRSRLQKKPYTLVLNTTKDEEVGGVHPEEVLWKDKGLGGSAPYDDSDFPEAPNGIWSSENVLTQYTQDFFDMTGKNHWYAVVGGSEILMNAIVKGGSPPASADFGTEQNGLYYNVHKSYAQSQPNSQGPVKRYFLDHAANISADYTGYYFYPMSEFRYNYSGTQYDQDNPRHGLTYLPFYEERSWIKSGTYPVPYSNVDIGDMQQGPKKKLRNGVRFWNVHEDFDTTPGADNYIPGFDKVGGEPTMYDQRAGGVGYAAYRALGNIDPNMNTAKAQRQEVIGTQLFFRPGSGQISRMRRGDGVYSAFGGYFGTSLQLSADTVTDTDQYFRLGNVTLPFYYGMVDTEDLSIYRMIQVDPASGTVEVSKRPHMAW